MCTDTLQVEGPLNRGVVQVHMVKPVDKNEWEYLLLALDVNGQSSCHTSELCIDFSQAIPELI